MSSPSLSLAEPLWKTDRQLWTEKLTDRVEGYTHTIEALGGYWNASFTERGKLSDVEDWLEKIGYHFQFKGDAGVVRWEGFVDKVTITAGTRNLSRGPLLDVGNRVYLVYSTVDTSVSPPIVGVRAKTDVANDTDSQARWGIQYKVLSTGGVSEDNAPVIRDRFLEERAEPKVTKTGGATGDTTATVELRGYVHLLNYPYNQTTTGGTIDLSATDGTGKMQLVLADDPNGIFSTDYSKMDNNTLQVPAWENKDRLALDLLQALTSRGDATFDRYLFGIYNNRRAEYKEAPTDTAYHERLEDPKGRITTPSGVEVKPWDILPGRWLKYVDFQRGRVQPSNQRLDSRFEFIESVTFIAPYEVTHRGGETDTITQMLATYGLSGVGA